MLSLSWSISVHAQSTPPTLFLRPHCDVIDQTLCPQYDAADPSMLRTTPLKTGDTLDLDIVLINPTQEKIAKVRLWISYDAEAMEGTTLAVSPAFPVLTPGEVDFSPLSGYAKIAASAKPGGEPADAILPVARLTFTIKNSAAGSTPLSFYDRLDGIDGHTVVSTVTAPQLNLIPAPLGALLVQFSAPVKASSGTLATHLNEASSSYSSSVSDVSSASASSAEIPAVNTPDDASTFSRIQAQNVRVGTKENTLYVTWDALSHPKLQGYNVYYGTQQGRYLNRRSVSVASRGAVIRDLPAGKTYYAAVRGVDDGNRETAFSTEASVEIGNPSTSSASIVGSLDLVAEVAGGVGAPENPVREIYETPRPASAVPGESGVPSSFLLLLLGSAAIGSLLAFRRQLTASRRHPV